MYPPTSLKSPWEEDSVFIINQRSEVLTMSEPKELLADRVFNLLNNCWEGSDMRQPKWVRSPPSALCETQSSDVINPTSEACTRPGSPISPEYRYTLYSTDTITITVEIALKGSSELDSAII